MRDLYKEANSFYINGSYSASTPRKKTRRRKNRDVMYHRKGKNQSRHSQNFIQQNSFYDRNLQFVNGNIIHILQTCCYSYSVQYSFFKFKCSPLLFKLKNATWVHSNKNCNKLHISITKRKNFFAKNDQLQSTQYFFPKLTLK